MFATTSAGPWSFFHSSDKTFPVSWFRQSRTNSTSVAFESSAFWRSSLITSFSVYPWSKFWILFVRSSYWPNAIPIPLFKRCCARNAFIPSFPQLTFAISGWTNFTFFGFLIQSTSLKQTSLVTCIIPSSSGTNISLLYSDKSVLRANFGNILSTIAFKMDLGTGSDLYSVFTFWRTVM